MSCSSECWFKPGATEYREIAQAIVRNDNSAAVRRFSDLPVDMQITVYLYARDCPDDPRIEPMLIENGEKKIKAIVKRIETEAKLWDKANLAGVLIAINSKCRCIRDHSQAIAILEGVSQALDNDKEIPPDYVYKQIFQRRVESLKMELVEQTQPTPPR